MANSESWAPDEGLIFTVRTRSISISTLEGPDRAWIVAALTTQGWTVAAIAERLRCSLRLVQQIKAEPMTKVALYAMAREKSVAEAGGLSRIQARMSSMDCAEKDRTIERLTRQRDVLLEQLAALQRGGQHAAA